MPLGLKAENVSATSADIAWTASTGAESYVIRYGVDGQTNDRLYYSETSSFVLNDTVFGGTLAGQKINVCVEAYAKTYTGTTEIDQANNAMKDTADNWSTVLTIDYPAE